MSKENRIKIPIRLQPYEFDKGLHVVEKTDTNGAKKRYLKGITSGIKIDGHGERMTSKAIESMQKQANSGSVLLYEGQHGVNYTDDLGILEKGEITQTGDWLTEYRLYDESDDVGETTIERCNKLWKQVNGLPPYVDKDGTAKPIAKGFSIEGYIPDGGILEMSETGQRVIDEVLLDGVVVTPRPSYKTSIVAAIYKALDELSPPKKIHVANNIRTKFLNNVEDEKKRESYYSKRYKLEDALNESVEEIMQNGNQVRDRLDVLFDEYKSMMIQLITEHESVFVDSLESESVMKNDSIDIAKMQRIRVLKNITDQLQGLVEVKKSKTNTVKKSNRSKQNGKHNSKRR